MENLELIKIIIFIVSNFTVISFSTALFKLLYVVILLKI